MNRQFPEYTSRRNRGTGPQHPLVDQAEARQRSTHPGAPVFVALAVALLIVLIVGGYEALYDNPARVAADRAAVPSAQAGLPVPQPVEKAPPVPTAMDEDGIYVVGKEIKPGEYRATGTWGCYWARLQNLTGEDDVIANWFGDGRVTVRIVQGDVGFETNNCGPWELVK